MNIYKFKTPGLFPGVTAKEAAEELERIREKHGILSARVIVEESMDEKAILHRCFQWDDTKAAALYRESQARDLIRNLIVMVEETIIKGSVRAYVNVTPAQGQNRSYVPLYNAMLDDTARADLLNQAKRDSECFIAKYSQLEELNKVKEDMLYFINGLTK